MSIVTYIMILFGATFVIPWLEIDVFGLALLHTGIYSWYFWHVRSYVFRNYSFAVETPEYFQAMVVLFIASVVCIVITKRENERVVERFILLKEVEEKNKQMQKELELATKVHKTLIPKSLSTDLVDISVMYLPMYYIGGDYAKFHFITFKEDYIISCHEAVAHKSFSFRPFFTVFFGFASKSLATCSRRYR